MTLIKVNKQKAKRLFNEGMTIQLFPCKMRIINQFMTPMDINKKDFRGDARMQQWDVFDGTEHLTDIIQSQWIL